MNEVRYNMTKSPKCSLETGSLASNQVPDVGDTTRDDFHSPAFNAESNPWGLVSKDATTCDFDNHLILIATLPTGASWSKHEEKFRLDSLSLSAAGISAGELKQVETFKDWPSK
jgi:hypothetical protein